MFTELFNYLTAVIENGYPKFFFIYITKSTIWIFLFTKIKSLGIMLIHLYKSLHFIFFLSLSVKLSMRVELYNNAYRGHFC